MILNKKEIELLAKVQDSYNIQKKYEAELGMHFYAQDILYEACHRLNADYNHYDLLDSIKELFIKIGSDDDGALNNHRDLEKFGFIF